MEAHTVKVAQLRIHPLIQIETCFVCLGRGWLIGWRGRLPVRERCVTCASKGSLIRDDSGAFA